LLDCLVECIFDEVKEDEVEMKQPEEPKTDNGNQSPSAPNPTLAEADGCTTAMLRNLPNNFIPNWLNDVFHSLPLPFQNLEVQMALKRAKLRIIKKYMTTLIS